MALTIHSAPARAYQHRRAAACPTGCQTKIKAPLQALEHAIEYCIDCHRPYVAVPLDRWSQYVRLPAAHELAAGHAILAFRRSQ